MSSEKKVWRRPEVKQFVAGGAESSKNNGTDGPSTKS
jgi:hypothetical protein